MKNQKILITGGLGFIGSNLAYRCLDLGAKVTIFDCLDPNSGGNVENVDEIKNSIEFCFHSILDFDRISQHVVDKDIIFNCAASTSHSFSMREPWLDSDTNSRGVLNLLEAVRRLNTQTKLVHVGTSSQLGRILYNPADESHPEFPIDIYSANKVVSEKYVLVYARAHQMQATVIRLSNVFGPRASIHSPEFTFNNYFIGLALQKKDVTVFGDGKQLRNVLYVRDAVSALIQAALVDRANGETLFAVGDEHYSVTQIAELTTDVIGGQVKHIDWPKNREVIEVGNVTLSNEKIKQVLGWKPEYDLKNGLIETKEYFLPRLDRYLK